MGAATATSPWADRGLAVGGRGRPCPQAACDSTPLRERGGESKGGDVKGADRGSEVGGQ